MVKLSVRLAFVFLLFAVISRAAEDNAVELITGESDTSAETTTAVDLPPLTLIRFRHVSRRFPRGPLPLTFRRGKPCRGIHRRRDDDHISYGNDMIVSSSEDRQIPIRWSDLRAVGQPGSDDPLHRPHPHRHRHRHHDHDDEDQFDFDHHHYHHHHRYRDHDHHHGFLMGLRKFLGHF